MSKSFKTQVRDEFLNATAIERKAAEKNKKEFDLKAFTTRFCKEEIGHCISFVCLYARRNENKARYYVALAWTWAHFGKIDKIYVERKIYAAYHPNQRGIFAIAS